MQTKRLTASEREALVRMNIVLDILTEAQAALNARSALIPGEKRDLGLLKAKIKKLMDAYADTIPDEQLKTYVHSLRMVSYCVGVKRPGTEGKRNDRDYGMWMPYETVNSLLIACHEHCLMCASDRQERDACPLRKTLDSIPNDVPARADGDCPYYTLI